MRTRSELFSGKLPTQLPIWNYLESIRVWRKISTYKKSFWNHFGKKNYEFHAQFLGRALRSRGFRGQKIPQEFLILSHFVQEWPRQTKPKKGQFMNFSQGHSGTKVRYVNRACFPKEKHQNSQKKWAKFIRTFRFGPFFGLVCRGDSWQTGQRECNFFRALGTPTERPLRQPKGSETLPL